MNLEETQMTPRALIPLSPSINMYTHGVLLLALSTHEHSFIMHPSEEAAETAQGADYSCDIQLLF